MVKAWSTELGLDAASANVQVHGGMGFIEETGAAQHFRDARIALIYEGTNGVQAQDLVVRKLARDRGAAARELVADIRACARDLASSDGASALIEAPLGAAAAALEAASAALVDAHDEVPARALAGSVPYLRLVGLAAGGWLMARSALAAERRLLDGIGDPRFAKAKIATARFYAEHMLAAAPALLPAIRNGDTVLGFDADLL